MVSKLLGDPTYFPIEFRRWLKDFFDNSDITISPGQIEGGGAGGGSDNPTLLPAGIIIPYAGSGFGRDCLVCNGAPISRTDYPDLFSAIGVAWGNGDGSTTFQVPDLRSRALYGVGTTAGLTSPGQTDGRSLGNRGGPLHSHGFSNAQASGAGGHTPSGGLSGSGTHGHSYYHPIYQQIQQGTQGGFIGVMGENDTTYNVNGDGGHGHTLSMNPVQNHTHPVTGGTTGGYDTDRPSFAGVTYVITTGRSSAT